MTSGSRLVICCEPGCTRPRAAWSRVRCEKHYTPPKYAGHIRRGPLPEPERREGQK
jgi:hypothetical protein